MLYPKLHATIQADLDLGDLASAQASTWCARVMLRSKNTHLLILRITLHLDPYQTDCRNLNTEVLSYLLF